MKREPAKPVFDPKIEALIVAARRWLDAIDNNFRPGSPAQQLADALKEIER